MNKTKIKFLSDLPVKVLSKDEVNIGGQTFRRPLIKHYLDYWIPWFCDVLYGEYKGFCACDQDDWKRILKMMDGFGEHMPPETEEPAPFSDPSWTPDTTTMTRHEWMCWQRELTLREHIEAIERQLAERKAE